MKASEIANLLGLSGTLRGGERIQRVPSEGQQMKAEVTLEASSVSGEARASETRNHATVMQDEFSEPDDVVKADEAVRDRLVQSGARTLKEITDHGLEASRAASTIEPDATTAAMSLKIQRPQWKAVILDVDGTLLDSVDFHAQAWEDAFKEFGFKFPFDDIRRQIGKGGDQLLPVFLSEAEIADCGHALEERRGVILKKSYIPRFVAFPDVRNLVEKMLSDGIKVALGSSAKEDELEAYKNIANIADLITKQTTSSDAKSSKPDPDIFQATMEQLPGVSKSDVLVIGDTPYDAIAASKSQLKTIGVLCGGWIESELLEAGCIAIYQDPSDLLANYSTWSVVS